MIPDVVGGGRKLRKLVVISMKMKYSFPTQFSSLNGVRIDVKLCVCGLLLLLLLFCFCFCFFCVCLFLFFQTLGTNLNRGELWSKKGDGCRGGGVLVDFCPDGGGGPQRKSPAM